MSTQVSTQKSTMLLAPALAPIAGTDPLACAVRDLGKALALGGWQVAIVIGLDATNEVTQAGLRKAGLARRLAPLQIESQELIVYQGSLGDVSVLALATDGKPNAAITLKAALELGQPTKQPPALLQLWTDTASALEVSGNTKTVVHHEGSTTENLEAADLVFLSSKSAARAALRNAKSPLAGMGTKLHGLAPGYDSRTWNPERDSLLIQSMAPPTAATKAEAKAALRKELGLKDVDQPLLGVISRIEKLPRALGAELLSLPLQIVGVDAGPHIEALASRSPQNAASPRPDSDYETRQLRHRIVAAADFLLLPPGPSPTSQLFACRYGTSIIATYDNEPGDRLINFDANSHTGSGFLYRDNDELLSAIHRAIAVWEAGEEMRNTLIKRCLEIDLSWQTTVMRFDELVMPLL